MTSDLDELARLAWAQLWQVAVVAVLAGAIAKSFGRDRPRLAYALWMLVVVKSIVPPVWSSPTGLFSWTSGGGTSARRDAARAPFGPLAAPPAPTSIGEAAPRAVSGLEGEGARDRGMDWAGVWRALLLVWAVGVGLGAVFLLGKQLIFLRLIRRSRLPMDERHVATLMGLARRFGVRRTVRPLLTSRPIGPAAFGLFRPSILLPQPLLDGMPPERVELILVHELIHIRRGDVFAGALQLLAQLIWWFHPLVWWANREACRERERCCDAEVISGVGCRPALYARALLDVLEQKARLRPLVALPGVRALEVTSFRLETIMKYTDTDHRRACWTARFVFVAGLVLLVPGTGRALRAQAPKKTDAHENAVAAPKKTVAHVLRGTVREKDTGRPVAGARVSVTAKTDGPSRSSVLAVSDEAGRYTIENLSGPREYGLVATAKDGGPYLITSRRIKLEDDQVLVTADVELVRGVPFRVRALDRETGKPIKGMIVYFPINSNDPFKRGVMGYVASGEKGSAVCGAFYEAHPDDRGEYRGAVLPGPGFLGFSHPYKPGDESRADRKPVVYYPDGKQGIKLVSASPGGPLAFVPISSDPLIWTGLPLGQYDAVIAINPREGAKEAAYEIRVAADKVRQ